MEKKNTRRHFGMFSALCGVMLMAGQAFAFGGGSNTSAQIHGCGTHVIDLNGAAAGTDVSVFMSASGPLVTLFNAECTVKARNDYRWLNVNVYIDGALVPPSNSDNAFCTSTGDNALQHWVSASTNGYRYVSAGWHRVRVTAGIAGCAAGDQFRLDDTSLIGFRGL